MAEAEQQFVVSTERSLNMRLAGNGSAAIVASLKPHTIVHVTGEANAAGYGEAHVRGWLGTDDKTLYCDSFSAQNSAVDAVILHRPAFQAEGAQDVFGRQPGIVKGWVYLAYLTDAFEASKKPSAVA